MADRTRTGDGGPRGRWSRFQPAEGWTAVALHAAIVALAAWAIQRADLAPNLAVLPPIAVGGAAIGLGLAKTKAPDLLAHLIALAVGIVVVVAHSVATLDRLGQGRRARLEAIWSRLGTWFDRTLVGRQSDDVYLFVVLIGVTTFLVAYMSAWTLFRRRWLMVAVLLPGFVILLNLGYRPEIGPWPLALYLVAACTLAARHFAYRRQLEWDRARIPAPERLPWHFVGVGGNLALAIVAVAWAVPLTVQSDTLDRAWERVDAPWQAIERRWDRWLGALGGQNDRGGGSYSAFGDEFELGGPLELGDDPVLRFSAAKAAYLAGHRYDRYDGHGWASEVERTFDETGADGRRFSPQLTFQPNQRVNLSDGVREGRSEVAGTITVLAPKGDLLFTTDTFSSTDRATSVQLSWRQLQNESFPIRGTSVVDVPADLRRMAYLLQQATFGEQGANARPTDPAQAAEIAEERAELRGRFLDVRWEVGDDGVATRLLVTGQLPVYDDVEAIYEQRSDGPAAGERYGVVGLASDATPEQLRGAGDEYPRWVTDRYLPLPGTVTERTRALARQIAGDAGATTAFDVAMALQNDLRTRIVYEEAIAFPPDDQDVVDFVLFESKEGYCEYYASAMAVMLRTMGVPSRVVAGFYPGELDRDAGSFLYRERNAHAWVEAYFPSFGWVAFEPTANRPAIVHGADRTPEEDATEAVPEATPTPTPVPEPTVAAGGATPPSVPPAPIAGSERSLLDRSRGGVGLVGGALLVLALLVAAAVAVWAWGLRDLSPAGGWYARMLRAGRWWGVRTTPATTPGEFAVQLGRAVPSAQGPARVVADLYVRERYAGRAAGSVDDAKTTGRTAWRAIRRALVRSGFGLRGRRRQR